MSGSHVPIDKWIERKLMSRNVFWALLFITSKACMPEVPSKFCLHVFVTNWMNEILNPNLSLLSDFDWLTIDSESLKYLMHAKILQSPCQNCIWKCKESFSRALEPGRPQMTTAQVDNTIGSKIISDQATCNYEMTLAPKYTVTQLETRSNEILLGTHLIDCLPLERRLHNIRW